MFRPLGFSFVKGLFIHCFLKEYFIEKFQLTCLEFKCQFMREFQYHFLSFKDILFLK